MTNIVIMRDIIIEYCGFDQTVRGKFLRKSFDECLIGVSAVCNDFIPAYDYNLLIKKIEKKQKLSPKDAIDYFNQNILDKYPFVSFIYFTDKTMDELSVYNPDMLFFDDLTSALIGFKIQKNNEMVAAYDKDLCLNALSESMDDMETAMEWFEFNTTQAYVGEHTPCIVYDLSWN